MKLSKIVLGAIFIISLSILIYLLIFKLLFPSYLSVISVCNKEKFNEKYANYYFITGSTSLYLSEQSFLELNDSTNVVELNDSEYKIAIEIFDTNDPIVNRRTYKHEICHKHQLERNYLKWKMTCNHQISYYFAELECYIRQYL